MPEADDWQRLAEEWLGHLKGDLEIVRLASGSPAITDAVLGFHAQQVVEKGLKAAIAAKRTRPPRTHSLRALANDVRRRYGLGEDPLFGEDLTEWATSLRYPGAEEPATPLDRRQILRQVESVVTLTKSLVARA